VTAPELKFIDSGGVRIALWDWPGDGPPLLFAHATGFHGRCWDELIRRCPGRRAVAIDFRGHGRSCKPEPPYPWRSFGLDLAAAAEALDLRNAIGIGHSMGGHSIVACAIERPETFGSLVLVDPTIFTPAYYGAQRFHDTSFIKRRRNVWKSPDEMFERFHKRPPFDRWQPQILRDYCEYGLLPDGDNFVLACPPEIEASIYQHSNAPDSNLYPWIPSIALPVTVMRGGHEWRTDTFDLSSSPTAADLATKFPNGRDVPLEGHSHYIPMESPDLVVERIGSFLVEQA
jgi:lipase